MCRVLALLTPETHHLITLGQQLRAPERCAHDTPADELAWRTEKISEKYAISRWVLSGECRALHLDHRHLVTILERPAQVRRALARRA